MMFIGIVYLWNKEITAQLILMYESGKGVTQDSKEAIKWYRFW